jgi:putative ABC transport system permease protein
VLKSFIAAALRNLARSKLYAAISIVGLAIGISSVLLLALLLRNQYGFDHFIPNYQRIYLAVSVLLPKDRAPDYQMWSHSRLAELLKVRFRQVQATTRVMEDTVELHRGEVRAKEFIYWADPNFLDVLALPTLAGDRATALKRADGIVLPRSVARKYFGHDAPIGETLRVAGEHPMTVTAVIEDLPDNGTQLNTGILACGLASFSGLAKQDNDPAASAERRTANFAISVRTYLMLAPGASLQVLQAAMPSVMDALWSRAQRPPGLDATLELVKLDRVHVHPRLFPGVPGRFAITVALSAVILFIACINFINLTTARASRRAREVMVRKASGASRHSLVVQFLGESFIYVMLAVVLAIAFTELMLPATNAFLQSGMVFDYWRHPELLAWILIGAVVLSVIAGLYPAFVLSSFRPAGVLRGVTLRARGSQWVRQSLVTLQFAVLVTLIVSAAVVYQQRLFALEDALRVKTDEHLMIRAPCRPALTSEIAALSGVRGVACTSNSLLTGASFGNYRLKDGTERALGAVAADHRLFQLYGFKPVAGRFFTAADLERTDHPIIINETAARRLGYASPAAAIGDINPFEIIGVVADFTLSSIEREIQPTLYSPRGEPGFDLLDVKLSGGDIPETLRALDALWTKSGEPEPMTRYFLNDYIQALYIAVLRVAQAFGVMSGIAVVLACLGLIGLSASTTDRRVKEIGVRKAMGAGTNQILRLLLWQFTKPVLWANLIAWPLAAWLMTAWLESFAYHIDLPLWPFAGATLMAVAIALVTVGSHCYCVARERPVLALHYE